MVISQQYGNVLSVQLLPSNGSHQHPNSVPYLFQVYFSDFGSGSVGAWDVRDGSITTIADVRRPRGMVYDGELLIYT